MVNEGGFEGKEDFKEDVRRQKVIIENATVFESIRNYTMKREVEDQSLQKMMSQKSMNYKKKVSLKKAAKKVMLVGNLRSRQGQELNNENSWATQDKIVNNTIIKEPST